MGLRKMDISDPNSLKSSVIWIQSLGLLFASCEPLTYDCLRTEDEYQALIDDISRHAYYCAHVKECLDHGNMPLTWDEWNNGYTSGVENGKLKPIEVVDVRSFCDIFTDMFNISKRQ